MGFTPFVNRHVRGLLWSEKENIRFLSMFLLFIRLLITPRSSERQNGIFGNVILPLRLIGLKICSANRGCTGAQSRP